MITVDAYCHLGECRVYDQSVSETELIDALNLNRVNAVVVQPFPGAPNPAQVHDQIADLANRYAGRIFGVVNVNPHIDRDRYHNEIERCVRQLGFVGIALDTLGHAVNPTGQDAQTVFEAARELQVPILIHPGLGGPFGLPSRILPRAREYSDVKVILLQAGAASSSSEALFVAREVSNVYLELSGCSGEEIKRCVAELGGQRILFGSRLPANQASELAKYHAIGLYQFQQYAVLGQSARDVFALPGIPELAEPTTA